MNSRWSTFLLILTVNAVIVSAQANETNIFSAPVSGSADQPDLIKNDTQPQLNAGSYSAPHQLFHNYTPRLPPPHAQTVFLGNQDDLNRRKNWALMTPAQIFGVQSPEEVLGIKNPGSEKNLSLEEQFLLRQSRPTAGSATNGSASAISWRDSGNPFNQNQDDKPFFSGNAFSQPDDQAQPDSTRYFKQFLKANTDGSRFQNDTRQATTWDSVFSRPTPPKQTPAQAAGMARFRAMLEPTSSLDTAPGKAPAVKASLSSSPAPAADLYLQPAAPFNLPGHSTASVQDNTLRPVGIPSLSGISGSEQTAPAVRPAWQAQLPPWMREGPQAQNTH